MTLSNIATLLTAATMMTVVAQAEAATQILTFQGERFIHGAGDLPLPLPGFAQFIAGEIIYDDSVPVVEDLSLPAGPVYRQFGAMSSFSLSFANNLGFMIGETFAGPGLVDGQAAVQDFPVFSGAYFRTDAFSFDP